jgi:hypothetical protein
MYSIEDIKFQNQQDCFTYLFYYLSRALLGVLGRKGEEAVRGAVKTFGAALGERARQNLTAAGYKPNLKELAERGADCIIDPRFRFHPIRATEQELWLEVLTCPMADLWRRLDAGKLGLMFCEEYCHAYFGAFSEGIAQTNLSKILTCPDDNHCRLSVYYRPANLDAEKRAQVFSLYREPPAAELKRPDGEGPAGGMKYRYYLLYQSFYDAAEEAGEEGKCAVAVGLRELAAAQAEELRRHADETRRKLDGSFIRENFPGALEKRTDGLYDACLSEQANRCLDVNFCRLFLDRLELLGASGVSA